MSVTLFQRGASLVLVGLLMTAALTPAKAADRPADAILAEIKGVEIPQLDPRDRKDQQKVKAFIPGLQKAVLRQAALIGELYKAYPDNPALVTLMPERWKAVGSMSPDGLDTIKGEVAEILARGKNEKLAAEAAFFNVVLAFQKADPKADAQALLPTFEQFAKRFPDDPRGAMVLGTIAERTTDEGKKAALNKRLEKDYPDSPIVRSLTGGRRQVEGIGKPFAIEFNDAIKGSQVNAASLKGKVVIVDFWATWCGPCVAEMPKMKKLYAEYKPKGVEFIGVSLDAPRDQGGYDKLKDFVEKNKIDWPQYYEGKTSGTEFATEWGIQGIPTVFALDADGKLASVDARGKLDDLIPELLAKAKKADAKP